VRCGLESSRTRLIHARSTMAPVPGLRVPPNVDQPALPPASQYPAIAVGDQMERCLPASSDLRWRCTLIVARPLAGN
jgi:hypothetical protein